MECVACKCDLGTSTQPMLLTCGHLCCETCLRPEELFQCASCHQVALVATRLFVTVGDSATESEHVNEGDERPAGLQGQEAEACLTTATQQIRQFIEQHLSPTTLRDLRLRNEADRRRVSTKMSTYFSLRQQNIQMQKRNADLLKDLTEGHRALKEAKKQLSRESTALEKNQRMYQKEVDGLNTAIARASQSVQRRLRHV
ncbi:hypothetical protein C8T65DRAFT_144544 [Cerioporus squamosus]|nr:hypothetical protein C8T65DRAFT_144544 [Cerioporus squamosus]